MSTVPQILGAGSFGIVTEDPITGHACKYFYDIKDLDSIEREIRIQKKAKQILEGLVKVPTIYSDTSNDTLLVPRFGVDQEEIKHKQEICGVTPTWGQSSHYRYGFSMEKVPLVTDFNEQVHIVLGIDPDREDMDSVWSRNYIDPASDTNPPRGFHASSKMMELIWEDAKCDHTIDSVAKLMRIVYERLLDNGIIPYDVEWIWGGDGKIWMIDFGLCEEFDSVTTAVEWKTRFFSGSSSQSILSDMYVPSKGLDGYVAFSNV